MRYRIRPVKPGIDYRPFTYRKTYDGAVKVAKRYFDKYGHGDVARPREVIIDQTSSKPNPYRHPIWTPAVVVSEFDGRIAVEPHGAAMSW